MNIQSAKDTLNSAESTVQWAAECALEVNVETATRNEDRLYLAVMALIRVTKSQNELLRRLIESAYSRL